MSFDFLYVKQFTTDSTNTGAVFGSTFTANAGGTCSFGGSEIIANNNMTFTSNNFTHTLANGGGLIVGGTNTFLKMENGGTAAAPWVRFNGSNGNTSGFYYTDNVPSIGVTIAGNGIWTIGESSGALLPVVTANNNIGAPAFVINAGWIQTDWNVTSDGRDKKNVVALDNYLKSDYLSVVNKLKPISYEFIKESNYIHFGLIAQEVMQVLESVQAATPKTLHIAKEEEGKCSIAYTEFTPILIGAIKQLSDALNNVYVRLAKLETKPVA
jgi:hypothetical protein